MTEEQFRDQLRALEMVAAAPSTWIPPNEPNTSVAFPSACNCGEDCSCPGCAQHNGVNVAASSSAFSSCTNPGACAGCIDCTILSLPGHLPPDTSLSLYDARQADSVDDWIRQVSSLPPPTTEISTPPDQNLVGQQQLHGQWGGYLPPVVESHPRDGVYSVQACCGVLCKCDPEDCECALDSETGYDCRREMLFPTFGSTLDLVDEEDRDETKIPVRHYMQEESVHNDTSDTADVGLPVVSRSMAYNPIADSAEVGAARSQSANGYYFEPSGMDTNTGYLTIPQVSRSRSSSTSSLSSVGQGLPRPSSSMLPSSLGMFGYIPSSMTMSSPNLTVIPRKLDLSRERMYRVGRTLSGDSPTSSVSGSGVNGGVNYAMSNSDPDAYI